MASLPVSVVIPTLGRASLAQCIDTVAACRPPAAEILVSLQGPLDRPVESSSLPDVPRVEIVRDEGRGVARSTNLGIRAASHQVVAVTHDDCTVAADWVAVAHGLAIANPGAVLTGRVLPAGERPERVPSCKVDRTPHDFTGELDPGALYPANMVLPRDSVLEFGGFDERFGPREPAEDCDFAYRWLRAGKTLRFEPDLVVEHHDWRSDEELARLYHDYGFGLGTVYGKHLRTGDPRVVRCIARDVRWIAGSVVRGLRGQAAVSDPRRHIARGLPAGLIHGLRAFVR